MQRFLFLIPVLLFQTDGFTHPDSGIQHQDIGIPVHIDGFSVTVGSASLLNDTQAFLPIEESNFLLGKLPLIRNFDQQNRIFYDILFVNERHLFF